MDKLKSDFFQYIKAQGFSIMLLLGFSYYFYIEIGMLQQHLRNCEQAYRDTLLELISSRESQYKTNRRLKDLESDE